METNQSFLKSYSQSVEHAHSARANVDLALFSLGITIGEKLAQLPYLDNFTLEPATPIGAISCVMAVATLGIAAYEGVMSWQKNNDYRQGAKRYDATQKLVSADALVNKAKFFDTAAGVVEGVKWLSLGVFTGVVLSDIRMNHLATDLIPLGATVVVGTMAEGGHRWLKKTATQALVDAHTDYTNNTRNLAAKKVEIMLKEPLS